MRLIHQLATVVAMLFAFAPGAAVAGARARPPTIVITGDILLAGRVERLIEQKGAAAPFAQVQDILRSADLAIGNLECPLATTGTPADKEFVFRAHPDTAAALVEAGFDLVTLANNHSADYGPGALAQTLETLRGAGLLAVGAGEDIARARQCIVVERGSPPVRIAVLGFSNMLPADFYATEHQAGTNPARLDSVTRDVAEARRKADVVIAIFHWGDELSDSPSHNQRALAAAAADAGADLVVGHHPHVLQGFEMRGRTLIAYSLGNFLFPSRNAARETVILRYQPRRNGQARVEIIPCVIEGFQPRPAPEDKRTACLHRLSDLSDALGARLPAHPAGGPDEGGTILLPARPRSVDKPSRAP